MSSHGHSVSIYFLFFFNDTATTEIYTLSLHDALPIWRELCIGNDVGRTYVWDHGFELDDLPAIHAFCLEEDARLRSYVESLDDTALTESVALGSDPDDIVPRWLIVAHVVNHGTQHRSELARYFTERGHSPGDMDLLDALHVEWPGHA